MSDLVPEVSGKNLRNSRSISPDQDQTKETFAFKWAKRETYESDSMQTRARVWLFERYCGGDPSRLDEWLGNSERKQILDAGCGSGFSALLFFDERLKNHDYFGADISSAVDVAQMRFAERQLPGTFIKTDINRLPFADETFDLIFSEGVLHHTDDTGITLSNVSKKLKKNGHFLFYVYAKKSPIREFTDDFIRTALRENSDEQAWENLKSLTLLGQTLGEMNQVIDIPSDIPVLGIKKGKMDLQRFFYWNVCKMFYDPKLTLDEMNHINFDWFRPLNCHRHTPEEVRQFCENANLEVERLHVEESGITVVARKV